MNSGRLCLISLLANVLLASAVAWHFVNSGVPLEPQALQFAAESIEEDQSRSDVAPLEPSGASWAQVQSDDLRELIRNLEAAGWPKDTIRVILTAEVDRLYLARRAELPVNTNFWLTASQRDADRARRRQQERGLERAMQSLMKDLAGVDWVQPDRRPSDRDSRVELVSYLGDFLTDAKIMRLGELLKQYSGFEHEQPSSGTERSADLASRSSRADEFQKQLAETLTPPELEEFRLRCHAMNVVDVWSVADQFGSELSGPELRELLRITRADIDPLRKLAGHDDEPPPKDAARLQGENAAVRALLGEDRFVGYLAAQDSDFKLHHRFVTRELHLPSATAVVLHQTRRAAEARARAVRRDPVLLPEQRGAALDAVYAETSGSLARTLDAQSLTPYLKDQGGWIEQLRKP